MDLMTKIWLISGIISALINVYLDYKHDISKGFIIIGIIANMGFGIFALLATILNITGLSERFTDE